MPHAPRKLVPKRATFSPMKLPRVVCDRHTVNVAQLIWWKLWLQTELCAKLQIFVVHAPVFRCPIDAPGVSRFENIDGPFSGTFSPMNALWRQCNQLRHRAVYKIGKLTPSRSWTTNSAAVAKSCLGMHQLDNICSSSVYGLCVICPWAGPEAPRPCKAGPEKSHFLVLFRQWTPCVINSTSMKTKLTVWTTNIVVNAPGVSDSCID